MTDEFVIVGQLVVDGLNAIGSHEETAAGIVMAVHAVEIGRKWVTSAVTTLRPLIDRRYVGTSQAAQVAAAQNILAASDRVAETVAEYVTAGRLTEERGRTALDDPAFALLLNDRLLDASQSSDPMIHDALAKLVVERMTMTSGTAEALLMQMASARMLELGGRQLRLMGAIFVAENYYVDPFETSGSVQADFEYYTEQCNIEVRPHWDAQILEQDLDHLDSVNVIQLSEERNHRRTLGGGHYSPMLAEATRAYPEQMQVGKPDPSPIPAVYRRLNSWMEGEASRAVAFKYISFKGPGWIIGSVVHAHLRGIPFESGKWQ